MTMTRMQIEQDARLVARAEALGPLDPLIEAVMRRIIDQHLEDIARATWPPRPWHHNQDD